MNETEFNRIYADHARALYNYAVWMTGNRQASDDILQTVFLRVWRSSSVPTEESPQRAWLFTVCRNACLDYFRARTRSRRLRLEYARERPAHTEGKEAEGLIWRQLERLEDNDRTIVYLHIRMGWPYSDVARMLGMTENNVRVRAFRAFRRLRGVFAGSE